MGSIFLISDANGEKSLAIQVKTTQNKRKWILSQKVESDFSENKYYIFVNIPSDINSLPEYYIVKSKVLAEKIHEGHKNWLQKLGKMEE